MVLEKTPENNLDKKEIKSVNLKGNQPWKLFGRTDAEVETPVFWSSDVNSWLIGKVPDAGKDWRQKDKRVSEDEMAGWHYWCNEHELGQTPGDDEGQGGLACCSPCGCKGWAWLGSWTTTITTTIGYFIDFWTLYKIMQYVSCVSDFFDSTLCLGFTHDVIYSSWLFIFTTVE